MEIYVDDDTKLTLHGLQQVGFLFEFGPATRRMLSFVAAFLTRATLPRAMMMMIST
jgi:hypothetical protein